MVDKGTGDTGDKPTSSPEALKKALPNADALRRSGVTTQNDILYTNSVQQEFDELAYAAAKFIHQQQSERGDEAPASGAPVGNRVAGNDNEQHITMQDIAITEAEIRTICSGAGVPESDILKIITELKEKIGLPKSKLDEYRQEARGLADKAADHAAAKSESSQQTMDKAWARIDALNAEASKRLDALPLTETQKTQRAELEAAVEKAKQEKNDAARIKAQKELVEFYDKRGIEYNDPELKRLSAEMKKEIKTAESLAQQVAQKRSDALNQLPQDTVSGAIANSQSINTGISLDNKNMSEGQTGNLTPPQAPNKTVIAKLEIETGSGLG